MLRSQKKGFTLIELLIVIAIILILIAIALPNFLEAQIRARVAKANGEIRSLVIATAAYREDWKKDPPTMVPGGWGTGSWWGFASYKLTSPNKYIGGMPSDPFFDEIFGNQFTTFGILSDPPYTVIRDTGTATWATGGNYNNNPSILQRAGGPVPIPEAFNRLACHNGSIYYSSGPDLVDSTVWGTPQFYSPTNGTTSFGDLYNASVGDPYEDLGETAGQPPVAQMRAIIQSNCN